MGIYYKICSAVRRKDSRFVFLAIRRIKNWPLYFIEFLGLVRKPYVTYHMKSGLKYHLRANTSDRGVITVVDLDDDYELRKTFLPKDAVIIDLGAQIGVFSVLASKRGEQVYSFEPVPENFKLLLKNIEINYISDKVKPFNLAVSDKNEKLRLYLSSDNTGGHSKYGKGKFIDVQSIPLRQVFDDNKISHCDLIKLDVEGSEFKILYGLPRPYFKRIDRIFMEYHNIDDKELNHLSLKRFLEKVGYKVRIFEGYMFAIRN